MKRNAILAIVIFAALIASFFIFQVRAQITKNSTPQPELLQTAGQITSATETTAIEAPQAAKIEAIDIPLPEDIQQFIREESEKNGVPFLLTVAVIWQESAYDEKAISRTKDYGLMGINKVNHKELKKKLSITNFLEARDNVKAGTYLLGIYLQDHTMAQALMCYNIGETGAHKKFKKGITGTAYSKAVLAKYETLKKGETTK